MTTSWKRTLYVLVGLVWALGVGQGVSQLWSYERTAGASAQAPVDWPADTAVSRDAQKPTLVVLIHPHCPCSMATIGELAKLMATCHEKITTVVLMLRPEGTPSGWEQTTLWSRAAVIPGVTVISDADGAESRRFGVQTSGQSLLYSADGRLKFAGGITASRGHSGDNAGSNAIRSLVLDASDVVRATTPVYGCPLFDPVQHPKEGCAKCPS